MNEKEKKFLQKILNSKYNLLLDKLINNQRDFLKNIEEAKDKVVQEFGYKKAEIIAEETEIIFQMKYKAEHALQYTEVCIFLCIDNYDNPGGVYIDSFDKSFYECYPKKKSTFFNLYTGKFEITNREIKEIHDAFLKTIYKVAKKFSPKNNSK